MAEHHRRLGGLHRLHGRRCPTWLRSTTIPSRFISSIMRRPNFESPGVRPLRRPVAHLVLLVVGELHDAQAQPMEEGEVGEVVLHRARVLEMEADPQLLLALGAMDVVDGGDVDEGGVPGKPRHPRIHQPERAAEIVVAGQGGHGHRGAPGPGLRDVRVVFRHQQRTRVVDDDRCGVEGLRVRFRRPCGARAGPAGPRPGTRGSGAVRSRTCACGRRPRTRTGPRAAGCAERRRSSQPGTSRFPRCCRTRSG